MYKKYFVKKHLDRVMKDGHFTRSYICTKTTAWWWADLLATRKHSIYITHVYMSVAHRRERIELGPVSGLAWAAFFVQKKTEEEEKMGVPFPVGSFQKGKAAGARKTVLNSPII
jgi:hypothetical protein